MIKKIPNSHFWKIEATYYTFERLEKLYYAIGHELLDVAVENGDFDPPDQYNLHTGGKDHD